MELHKIARGFQKNLKHKFLLRYSIAKHLLTYTAPCYGNYGPPPKILPGTSAPGPNPGGKPGMGKPGIIGGIIGIPGIMGGAPIGIIPTGGTCCVSALAFFDEPPSIKDILSQASSRMR